MEDYLDRHITTLYVGCSMEEIYRRLFAKLSSMYQDQSMTLTMKKCPERRKHCGALHMAVVIKAEPIFSPRRRPLSWRAGRPKFNQLKMVTTFTYIRLQTKFGED